MPNIDLQRFSRDGYLVVPGVFSSNEIDRVKSALLHEARARIDRGEVHQAVGAPSLPFEAAVYPASRGVIFSDAVVSIVSEILGCQPIYFGDSGVSFGSGYTGWHRDNRKSDRSDGRTPDWEGEYDLIRVGVYLQDCAEHSGGLLIRSGSHRGAPAVPGWMRTVGLSRVHALRSRFHGKGKFVDSRKGDLVVWSLRSIHSGHAVRLKAAPHLVIDPKIQPRVPKSLAIPVDGMRAGVFVTYARSGPHYERYKKYIVTRDYFSDRPRPPIDVPPSVRYEKIV